MRSLALSLLLVLALALPATAAPAPRKVALEAEAGFDGHVKSGHWVPVTLTITNAGPEINGALQYDALLPLPPYSHTTVYEHPVVVPAGATRKVTLLVPPNVDSIRLMAGDELVRVILRYTPSQDLLVGLLGVEPAEVHGWSGQRLGFRTVRLVGLDPASLPAEPLALEHLDAILLDRFAWAELPAPQQAAIRHWVEHGGVLIAAGGPEAHRLEPLFPWLGVALAGVEEVDLEGIGPAHLARFEPAEASWQVTRRIGGEVLSFWRRVGAGAVHLLTFDPALEPFASWSGVADLERELLTLGMDRSNANAAPTAEPSWKWVAAYWPYLLSRLEVRDLPVSPRPLYLLGLYALLIGPVHLLLLRALRRLRWAVMSLPLLAVVATAATWGYAEAQGGAGVLAISLGVVEGQPGGESLRIHSLTGFYVPPETSAVAEVGGAMLRTVPVPPPPTEPASDVKGEGRTRVREGRSAVLEAAEEWQLRAVMAEAVIPVGGTVHADLVTDGSLLTGTLRNDLPYHLRDALVIAGQTAKWIGDLAPGQAAEVEVLMPWVRRLEGYTGVMPVAEAVQQLGEQGDLSRGRTAAERNRIRIRAQEGIWHLSRVLPDLYSLNRPPIVLAGWLETTGLPVSVDGRLREVLSTTLYVQPLAFRFAPQDFVLSPDFIQTRFFDELPGEPAPVPLRQGTFRSGTALASFLIPSALRDRVTGLELRMAVLDEYRPVEIVLAPSPRPGATEAVPGSQPQEPEPPVVQVYRWHDGVWVEHPFNPSGIQVDPAAGFLSPDGEVRVRISNRHGDILRLRMPELWVRGRGAGP